MVVCTYPKGVIQNLKQSVNLKKKRGLLGKSKEVRLEFFRENLSTWFCSDICLSIKIIMFSCLLSVVVW